VFSAEPTATGPLDLSRLKKVPWADLRAFKTKRVRLILCVGGWERSKHFAAAAGSEKDAGGVRQVGCRRRSGKGSGAR
jgi:hypothetical protein